MTNTATFLCETCYDTEVVDSGGREISCPSCPIARPITVKLTSVSLALWDCEYSTLYAETASTLTFVGTKGAILADARHNRLAAIGRAKRAGLTGRNNLSSPAIAIEARLRKQLAA
jgi:hypothetical protein